MPDIVSRLHLQVALYFLLLRKLYKQGARFPLTCVGQSSKSLAQATGMASPCIGTPGGHKRHQRVRQPLAQHEVSGLADETCFHSRDSGAVRAQASRITQVRAVVVTEDVLCYPDLVHLHYASS